MSAPPGQPAAGAAQRLLFFADASSVHTRRWVGEMAARGHECHVVTRLAGEVPGVRSLTVLKPGHDDRAGWFTQLPQVRRLAAQIAPDWVHGHYITSYGFWAAASQWPRGPGRRVPVALSAWGSDILVTPRESAFMRRLVRFTLRHADLVTADAQDVLDEIATYGGQASRHLILWGADTGRFVPAAQPAPGFNVLSLRSWEPNYNIDVIVEGFAAFLAQRPSAALVADARLHLLGGGPQEAVLRERAAALGIAPRVVFHGRVGDAAMVAAMQAARVSVSIPSSDATSVSVLESMACGLPLIASDLPANRAWVAPQGGRLIAPRDVAALAAALAALYDEPEAARAQGLAQRERALRDASRQGQMDRMSALYGQAGVLRGGGPRGGTR